MRAVGLHPPTLMREERMKALEDYGIKPDPVIEHYKKDVDRTLLRENLKLTVQERFDGLIEMQRLFEKLRAAGRKGRGKK